MRRLDTGCTALAVLITLAAAAVGSVQAQEAATDEGFGEELTVTEVLLDVVVTDKKDNLILGLGRDDFVVTERGEPVELGSVTFYSSKRLLESSEVLTRPDVEIDVVPQDRFFVIFVQEQTSRTVGRPTSYSRQIRAGRDLARWLV